MEKDTISNRLKQIMSMYKMRQIDILNKAKPLCEVYSIRLEKNDLSQYVNGKSIPSQKKLFILGQTLNVSEAWLMGYDVPMLPIGTSNAVYDKKNNFYLTPHEIQVVLAYRSHPDDQHYIDKILDVKSEKVKKQA